MGCWSWCRWDAGGGRGEGAGSARGGLLLESRKWGTNQESQRKDRTKSHTHKTQNPAVGESLLPFVELSEPQCSHL